eukprot:3674374-Prymnesium_polylepis.1
MHKLHVVVHQVLEPLDVGTVTLAAPMPLMVNTVHIEACVRQRRSDVLVPTDVLAKAVDKKDVTSRAFVGCRPSPKVNGKSRFCGLEELAVHRLGKLTSVRISLLGQGVRLCRELIPLCPQREATNECAACQHRSPKDVRLSRRTDSRASCGGPLCADNK